MTVELAYWIYATAQSMLMLTCGASAALFAYWTYETRQPPRPVLWALLPLFVWMDIGVALASAQWVVPRAWSPAYAVSMIQSVTETMGYWSYAVQRSFLLIGVSLQLSRVWTVRGFARSDLAWLFVAIGLASIVASVVHAEQMKDYCATEPLECRAS